MELFSALSRPRRWGEAKNTPPRPLPLPRQCVGVEGQVWFLLRPRHGPLSQYRAQTTAALSPRQLNSCFLPQAARRPPHSFPPAAG